MKKLILTTIVASVTMAAFAGEIPAALTDTTMHEATPFQVNLTWVAGLLLGLYELTVRFVPTVKDLSLLSYAMKLLQFIAPNLKQGGGRHTVG